MLFGAYLFLLVSLNFLHFRYLTVDVVRRIAAFARFCGTHLLPRKSITGEVSDELTDSFRNRPPVVAYPLRREIVPGDAQS